MRAYVPRVIHELTLEGEREKEFSVIPARIAGIQTHKDTSGDVHVNLDSSTPCWNDAIVNFSV